MEWLQILHDKFYLNVVGYKDENHARPRPYSVSFYLNVVGYKECLYVFFHALNRILSERSGI